MKVAAVSKDYDFDISYHQGKANSVTNALNRKWERLASNLMVKEWKLMEDVISYATRGCHTQRVVVASMRVEPLIINKIIEA